MRRPLLYAMAAQHKQLAAQKPKQLAESNRAPEQQQEQQQLQRRQQTELLGGDPSER
jgi:hypothetical protein